MFGKSILVAQREYMENVRTKTFWIGILAFPIILALSMGAGWVLSKLKETKSYAVVDYTENNLWRRIELAARGSDLDNFGKLLQSDALEGALARAKEQAGGAEQTPDVAASQEALLDAYLDMPVTDFDRMVEQNKGFASALKYRFVRLSDLDLDGLEPDDQKEQLDKLVKQGQLFAYFTLGAAPETSLEGFDYVSNNLTDNDLRQWYANAATEVVQSLRIASAAIPRDVAQRLKERVTFKEKKIGESGAAEAVTVGEKANKYAPIGFVYLLWIAIFTAAQMLLTNTVEEKSNRIIEVLLSSVSPLELMTGKIWGIAVTGLTIVGSWVLCALLGVWLAPKLIAGLDFPLMDVIGDPLYLGSFVVYFLLGYLLYAALLVGIGSVTNSLKEAQNLLQPIFIVLIIPLIAMVFIVQEPNGLVAKVLSYIPPFTPFTMMNRAGGPPEPWEYAVTGVLLLVSVWFAFKAAGKIFRVGVLMTGNPPRLREILGWLREK